MTSPTTGGWQHTPSPDPSGPESDRPTTSPPSGWSSPPPSRPDHWPPPPPRPPDATPAFAPAQSAANWATTQLPPLQQPPYGQHAYPHEYPSAQPYGEHAYPQQPGTPQPSADGSGSPWAAQPSGQGHGGPAKKSNKLVMGIVAAVVVAALIGGGLLFLLSGDDITYQGRDIVEPEKALADTESTLTGIVEQRHGATNAQTSCYFVAKDAQTTDIEDRVVCGPVLFVDGDESEPYLTFPIQVSTGDADARLSVASEPDSPDPAALASPDLLRRPDGASPPEGSGGLAVPDPPRADAGIFTVVPLDTIELESTPSNARIGSPTMSIDVSGIGEPERYGRGDDARRPAEGERFIGFEMTSGPGEVGPVGDFSIRVQVGEDDPIPLPDDADLSGELVGMVVSVPEDTDDVKLVVTEGALVQSLSLNTGEPAPGNVTVWQRANRSQQLTFTQPITIRVSQPGYVTEDFPATLIVNQVVLSYYAGPNLDRAPSAPGNAFLVLDAGLSIEGQSTPLDPPFWSLTLPDGAVLPAYDLYDDPGQIQIVFEVPASFTGAVLNCGGVTTFAGGPTFDSLGVFAPVPIAIAEG